MDIDVIKTASEVKITVDGNIDTDGGAKLSVSLQEVMEMKGVNSYVFDFSTVRTITSSGIGKLMNFFKFADGNKSKMAIKGISDSLFKQFNEIHLDRLFPISKS